MCVWVCMCEWVYACVYGRNDITYADICAYMYVHTCSRYHSKSGDLLLHTHTHTRTHARTHKTRTRIDTHTHKHAHIRYHSKSANLPNLERERNRAKKRLLLFMQVCMVYVCIYSCLHTMRIKIDLEGWNCLKRDVCMYNALLRATIFQVSKLCETVRRSVFLFVQI
jgi:hypothetical protein